MRIGTYNLRLMWGEESRWPWQKLFWVKRMKRIAKTITDNKVDIICVQEGSNCLQLSVLDMFLPNKYKYSSHKGSCNKYQCNAIFYDSTKYVKLDSYNIDLAGGRVLDCALLKDKSTGKSFTVASIHMSLNSEQTQIESIDIFAERFGDNGLYLCGDFNFTPSDRPYSYLLESIPGIMDVFKEGDDACTFTGFDCSGCLRIDYIFAPIEYAADSKTVVVGDELSSDHRMVYADINN